MKALEAGSATGGLHPQRPPSMEGAPETRALASLSVDEECDSAPLAYPGKAVPDTASTDKARDAAAGRKLLLRDKDALLKAATGGCHTEVRQLVACGADMAITGRCGWKPLHLAASGGHAAVVEKLLAAGAAVDAKDKHGGETPLHRAASEGRAAVVEQLLAAGAAVDAKNEVRGKWGADRGGRRGRMKLCVSS